jgi:hypothetical protein
MAFLLEAVKLMLGPGKDEIEQNDQCEEFIKQKLLPLALANGDDRCI